MRYPLIGSVAVVVVLAALASGCDSSVSPAASSSTDVPAPPVASTTTTTAPASTTSPQGTTTSIPRVPCGDEPLTQPPGTVLAFYAQCDAGFDLYPVYRSADRPPTLEESVALLVAGTTPAEQAFGLRTGFDDVEERDQIEVRVTVTAVGIARIDFSIDGAAWQPGPMASTSHQLSSFLEPLEATVFQHGAVSGIDPATIAWGESGLSETVLRQDWEAMLFLNDDIPGGTGCTPELAMWYPDDCTLDGIVARGTVRVPVTGVATDDVLNVRAGPAADYPVVAELAPIATVAATSETRVASDGGTWRLTDQGWVNEAYIAAPDPCDPGEIAAIASQALEAARLPVADTEWIASADGGQFGARTTDPDLLAQTQGFNCSWQALQHVGDDERLLVAAWTGDRVSMVLQATDGPTDPYSPDRTVDILLEAPRGELVAPDTWAVTLESGNTVILLARNHGGLGWLAKSWLADYVFVPGDGDSDPELTVTEQMALPMLRSAGGRGVSVAEPSHGSPVTSISLVSPSGDRLFATVGPSDRFDTSEMISRGIRFDTEFGTTAVRLVDPFADYPATVADFACNGYNWVIEADDGGVIETFGFVAALVSTLGCE